MEGKPLIQWMKKYRPVCMVCTFLLIKSSSIGHGIYFYNENHLKDKVKIGDFIVRQGTAYESAIIRQLSGNKYSHIGIIVQTTPRILIVHATTDDNPYQRNQVILSTLSEFVSPKLSQGWAIYRNHNLKYRDINFLVSQTQKQLGVPFDLSTKYEKTQGFYCTTLIANYLPREIYDKLQWQPINMPSLQGDILYPKALIDERVGSILIYQE